MLNSHSLETLVNSFENQSLPGYVVVATLFNELKATKRTAIQLSLCSKNARAITARAAGWGRSFSGVTSFIDESAKQMVSLADQIGDLAREMTKESVTVLFEQQLADKLTPIAENKLNKSTTLVQLKHLTQQATHAFNQGHDKDIHQLKRYLEDMKSCNRTLNAIVSICRVEASRAGPFQSALQAIAENISNAVSDLEMRIKMSDKLMMLLDGEDHSENLQLFS